MYSCLWDDENRKRIFTEKEEEKRKNYTNFGNFICRYQELKTLEIKQDCLFIDCSFNRLKEISNLSITSNLITLECHSNNLTNLNITPLIHLKSLNCSLNSLLQIDGLEYCHNLISLNCYGNHLLYLDLKNLNNLKNLNCSYNNLSSIYHVENGNQLERLICKKNKINLINLFGLHELKVLDLGDNLLKSENILSLDHCIELEYFSIRNNFIKDINVSRMKYLRTLNVENNQIESIQGIYFCSNVEYLNCNDNKIKSIYIGSLENLVEFYCCNNSFSNTHCIFGIELCEKLKKLTISQNDFYEIKLNNNVSLSELNIEENFFSSTSFYYFTSWIELEYLNISDNFWKEELDVSSFSNLKILKCCKNKLKKIVGLENCSQLETLHACDNELEVIHLYKKEKLKVILLKNNKLSGINLKECFSLESIDISNNNIESIYILHLLQLKSISCENNQIALIETASNPRNIISDSYTKIMFLTKEKMDMRFKLERLRNLDKDEIKLPVCSICRNFLSYPIKNAVGCHIQTYCTECYIRWFKILKKTNDPNTGLYTFAIAKEDHLFNELYDQLIRIYYEEYIEI